MSTFEKIPQPRPIPFLGNIHNIIRHLEKGAPRDPLCKLREVYGEFYKLALPETLLE